MKDTGFGDSIFSIGSARRGVEAVKRRMVLDRRGTSFRRLDELIKKAISAGQLHEACLLFKEKLGGREGLSSKLSDNDRFR